MSVLLRLRRKKDLQGPRVSIYLLPSAGSVPVETRHRPNADLMLGQCHILSTNIN